MRRLAAVVTALVLAMGVSGCGSDSPETPGAADTTTAGLPAEAADFLSDYGVAEGDDVREVIETLDQVDQQRPLSFSGSVRTDEVLFSDGTTEVAVPIPGDEVYVSIAPFAERTHDCHFHALGSCQGELTGEDFDVTITDDAGEVLVEEQVTTYANGFFGVWLPKDTTGTISVTDGERTGSAPFNTATDEATCITTLQLTSA